MCSYLTETGFFPSSSNQVSKEARGFEPTVLAVGVTSEKSFSHKSE